MRRTHTLLPLLLVAPASAQPTLGGPMSHLLVSVFNRQVFVSFESPHMAEVVMQRGESFTGPAAALNARGYNAQFGWLANGFIALPDGAGVFVRTVETSTRISVYTESGFAPILGSGGSDPVWEWNGAMVHNWYAASQPGRHRVVHEVFVGDAFGAPLAGWTPGLVELSFLYNPSRVPTRLDERPQWSGLGTPAPAPGTAAPLALAAVATRRRR